MKKSVTTVHSEYHGFVESIRAEVIYPPRSPPDAATRSHGMRPGMGGCLAPVPGMQLTGIGNVKLADHQ